MKVFIYACEGVYGGLHGIETYLIKEFSDNISLDDIYNEYVTELSREVMESYETLDSTFEEYQNSDEYDEEELEDIFEDIINDNIEGYVRKIKDDVKLSVSELDQMAFSLGAELFIKEYCK